MRAQSSYTNDDELFLSWQHDPLTSSPEESDDGMAVAKGERGIERIGSMTKLIHDTNFETLLQDS